MKEKDNLMKPYAAYKWSVFSYQLAFSLNWVVFLFFYYILLVLVPDPNTIVEWWDTENGFDHFAEIVLNTLPFVAMLIEYPFNQIPLDWRMLPFNILIIVLYAIFNAILVLVFNVEAIYEPLDWRNDTAQAIINFFIIIVIQVVVFALQWVLTEKFKLPMYRSAMKRQMNKLNIASELYAPDEERKVSSDEILETGAREDNDSELLEVNTTNISVDSEDTAS